MSILLVSLCLLIGATTAAHAQGPEGDRLIIGQDFVLRAGESVDGSLAVVGGDAVLEPRSRVAGDLALLGGDLRIAGTVEGDVVVFGGSIRLDETAVVQGSVAGIGSAVQRDAGARVEGEFFSAPTRPIRPELLRPETPVPPFLLPQFEAPAMSRRMSPWLWPVQALGWSLFMAFWAALGMLVAPRGVGRIANTAAAQPLASFGVGLVGLAAAALAGLILMICCCLGLVVWAVAWFAIAFGWIGIGLWAGQTLLGALRLRDVPSFLEAALGAFLITFASRLPFCIGGLIGLTAAALALGAVVLTRFGTRAYPDPSAAGGGDALTNEDTLALVGPSGENG